MIANYIRVFGAPSPTLQPQSLEKFAMDGCTCVITDPRDGRLWVAASDGVKLLNWEQGKIEEHYKWSSCSYGMAFDLQRQHLYVTRYNQNTMAVFDVDPMACRETADTLFRGAEHKPIRVFGEQDASARQTSFAQEHEIEGKFLGPAGVCLSGSRVYICDQRNNRVQIFHREGKLLGMFGGRGDAGGLFLFPFGIVVSPTDELVISDTWNHRMQVRWPVCQMPVACFGSFSFVSDVLLQIFDRDERFIGVFGGQGTEVGQFRRPRGLCFDHKLLLVCDGDNRRVQVFDSEDNYKFVTQFKLDSTVNEPWSVCIGVDGRIHVVDHAGSCIHALGYKI